MIFCSKSIETDLKKKQTWFTFEL